VSAQQERHRRFARARFSSRDSGAEAGAYTIIGHAAVFNEPCDFRYFKEYIAPGAFKKALAKDPLEVVSNWQHDDRWILGHTLSETLKLAEDDRGLEQWTRVAPTTYAADLRILIERGDIQQASFCFTIAADAWEYIELDDGTEEVKVTITEVGTLYDVTVCALGAYPQTDVQVAARGRFESALHDGRIRGLDLSRARKRGLIDSPAHRGVRTTAERSAVTRARAHVARARRMAPVASQPAVPEPEPTPALAPLTDPRLRVGPRPPV
jgi:HK97 family phage prohead protease